MYNNNRYDDKVITTVVTKIVEDGKVTELHDKNGVFATTIYADKISQVKIGKEQKFHIRQQYSTDRSFFLKVI